MDEIERIVAVEKARLEQQPGITLDISDKMGDIIRSLLPMGTDTMRAHLTCFAIVLRVRAFREAARHLCDALKVIGDSDAPKKNRP